MLAHRERQVVSHDRKHYIMSNVIIALLLWAGNRIPKKGVYFYAKKEIISSHMGREEPALEKTAYCNNMSKTFYSKKKGATTAEREITVAINAWKEKMEGLTGTGKLTPMSRVKDVYPDFLVDLQARTSQSNYRPVDGRFRKWILPLAGSCMVSDLSDGLVQRVINSAYVKGNLSKKKRLEISVETSVFSQNFAERIKSPNILQRILISPARQRFAKRKSSNRMICEFCFLWTLRLSVENSCGKSI